MTVKMTDRELLERAAAFAGIRMQWDGWANAPMIATPDGFDTITWNPLASDGDALRLAVNLHMKVCIYGVEVHVDYRGQSYYEHGGSDLSAATRRAITRAAALDTQQSQYVLLGYNPNIVILDEIVKDVQP